MLTQGRGIFIPRPYLKRCHRLLPSPLVGQAHTTLGAAAGKDLAAIASGHALTEAVLLGALTLFGLVGTKHAGHLLK